MGDQVIVRRDPTKIAWRLVGVSSKADLCFAGIIADTCSFLNVSLIVLLHNRVEETLLVVLVCDLEAIQLCVPRVLILVVLEVSVRDNVEIA